MPLPIAKMGLPPNLTLKEFNFMKYCTKLLIQALREGKEEVAIRKPKGLEKLPEEFKMTETLFYILVKITDKTVYYHITTSPTGKYHHKSDKLLTSEGE